MPIKVRYNGLEVDGNLVPLVSGSIQYWNLDPEQWGSILERVKNLGFSVIEISIPWSVHEVGEGEYDFGKIDPAKSLDHFLGLCVEKGMKVLACPGPDATLPGFGYPSRLLGTEGFWARDSFDAPSLASGATSPGRALSMANEALVGEFEPFLAALAPVLQKHLYPHGGVMAIRVDHHTGYFGKTGTYDSDYSDASVGLYRHFLELKYRQLKQMNEAYQAKHKSFVEVEPPRRPELGARSGLRRSLDWTEYKEYQLLWFLSKLAALFQAKGLGSVPFFHRYTGSYATPFGVADIEKNSGIEMCGLDGISGSNNSGAILDQARYLSAQSILPYIGGIRAGSSPLEEASLDLHDQEVSLLAPIMGGARAVNVQALVETQGSVGSPISAEGQERPELAQLFRRFNKFLSDQEWAKSSPQNVALLLESREVQQILAASLKPGQFFDGAHFPDALWRESLPKELLEASVEISEARRFYDEGRIWLRENSFPYALGDSSVSTEKLKKYSFVIASAWGYLDETYVKKLRSFAESGGYLVLGPEIPGFNSRFEAIQALAGISLENGKPASVGDGKILFLKTFDAKVVATFIRKGKVVPEVALSDTTLDLALHKTAGRNVLFVRNPHAEERPCTVIREGKFVLKPLWSSEKFLGAVEERDVRLGAHEIKVWEVISC